MLNRLSFKPLDTLHLASARQSRLTSYALVMIVVSNAPERAKG